MSEMENLIVIVNYNNYLETMELLNNLLKYKIKANIVVVDNNSSNESFDMLDEKFGDNNKNIFIIRTDKNLGYSGGNNYGIRYAKRTGIKFRFITIMNPDIEIVNGKIFDSMMDALNDDKKLVALTVPTVFNGEYSFPNVCCEKTVGKNKMIFKDNIIGKNILFTKYKKIKVNKNAVGYVDKIQGCFFMIKGDFFEEINYFDDNIFLYYEEDILAEKIKQGGFAAGVLFTELVFHNHQLKEKEISDLKNRRFHYKNAIKSKQYYMRNYLNCSAFYLKITHIIDVLPRILKDIYLNFKCKIKNSS